MRLDKTLTRVLGALNLKNRKVEKYQEVWWKFEIPVVRKDIGREVVYIFAARPKPLSRRILLQARWVPQLEGQCQDPALFNDALRLDYAKGNSDSALLDQTKLPQLQSQDTHSLALIWEHPQRPNLARLWGGFESDANCAPFLVGADILLKNKRYLQGALNEAIMVLSPRVRLASAEVPISIPA